MFGFPFSNHEMRNGLIYLGFEYQQLAPVDWDRIDSSGQGNNHQNLDTIEPVVNIHSDLFIQPDFREKKVSKVKFKKFNLDNQIRYDFVDFTIKNTSKISVKDLTTKMIDDYFKKKKSILQASIDWGIDKNDLTQRCRELGYIRWGHLKVLKLSDSNGNQSNASESNQNDSDLSE